MTSRGSNPDDARSYRQRGHANALRFALAIGMRSDYRNDPAAKKDVIDPSGDAHSLKSGVKKWQLFLYGRRRFEEDDGFQALNGVGELLIHCIDAFPPSREHYLENQNAYKERLRTPMRELRDRFQRKALLRAFLMKSIFNGGEVNYLTVLHEGRYHVFLNSEVVRLMGEAFEVVNSGSYGDNPPEQKVLFRHNGLNVGELEMRNDSRQHYQEVRFNMIVPRAVSLLFTIEPRQPFNDQVDVHGSAIRRFGNWAPEWRTGRASKAT